MLFFLVCCLQFFGCYLWVFCHSLLFWLKIEFQARRGVLAFVEVIRRRREAAPTRVAFSGKPEIMMVQGPSRWMRYLFIFRYSGFLGIWGKREIQRIQLGYS